MIFLPITKKTVIRNFARKINVELDFRFSCLLEDDLYVAATLLDPNIRLGFCQNPEECRARKEKLVLLLCRLNDDPANVQEQSTTTAAEQKKDFLFSSMKWNPATQPVPAPGSTAKNHAALEVDIYFADVISDEEINSLKYWKVNKGRFPLLSKLATEIYSCPATTAGIERVFSIAGHLIGLRATVMMDENFEQKFSVMSTRRLCFVAANENWLKSLNKYFRSGSFGFSGFQIISFGFVREAKFEQTVFGFRSFGLNSFSDQLCY